MDYATVDKICSQVYRKFPGFKGSRPKVSPYGSGLSLLVFDSTADTANGKSLHQTVRVVADNNGSIKKMTMSR